MLPTFPARILKKLGFKRSTDVTEAYFKGELSKIDGFGKGSIEKVKQWIDANKLKQAEFDPLASPVTHDGKKVYHLDSPEKQAANQKRFHEKLEAKQHKPEMDDNFERSYPQPKSKPQ
jgi:hypothetical protein